MFTYVCCMDTRLTRKEVHLGKATIATLSKLAGYEGRSLKNYMERVLITHAKDRKTPLIANFHPHKQ